MFDFQKHNQPNTKMQSEAKLSQQEVQFKNKVTNKYESSNLAKTFLIQYRESSSDNDDEDKRTSKPKQEEAIYQTKRSRKQKKLKELAPLTQAQSVVVYQNHHIQTQDHIPLQQSDKLRPQEKKQSVEDHIFQEIQTFSAKQFNRQRIKLQKQPSLVLKQRQLLLFEQDVSQDNTNKSSESYIELPNSKKTLTEFYSSSSQKQKSIIKERDNSNKKQTKNHIITKTIDFITNNQLLEIKRVLNLPLKSNTTLQLILNRNKDGLNLFWPQFYLQFQSQTTPLIAAKKVSSKPTATYIISTNPSNFQQNSKYYLGKIKSSLLGDINNLFGQGLNPDNARQASQVPRQLLATVVYSKLSASKSKPRQFEVFVKKSDFRYYLNFDKVKMYEEQVDLSELYKYSQNHYKIDRFYNKKPIYDEESQCFRLDFRGKVECSSIKNFILQKEVNGQDIMMFGKVNDSKFNIEISSPLTPLVGFAIALSSFDSRLLLGD